MDWTDGQLDHWTILQDLSMDHFLDYLLLGRCNDKCF